MELRSRRPRVQITGNTVRIGRKLAAVMLSIRPQWCELICNGKKTIEVRKTRPKLETPFKCYIYCTAPKNFYKISEHMATSAEYLHLCDGKVTMSDGFEFCGRADYKVLNRKVMGEFVCDNITEFRSPAEWAMKPWDYSFACLKQKDIEDYAGGKTIYGWHISDLQIYDKPKELSEFTKFGYDAEMPCCRLTRPFQSWGYVEELEEPCKTKN